MLASFILARDKAKRCDRVNGKYIIWAIYLQISGGVGVKYFDSLKLENNSYYIICRIIVPNTSGI